MNKNRIILKTFSEFEKHVYPGSLWVFPNEDHPRQRQDLLGNTEFFSCLTDLNFYNSKQYILDKIPFERDSLNPQILWKNFVKNVLLLRIPKIETDSLIFSVAFMYGKDIFVFDPRLFEYMVSESDIFCNPIYIESPDKFL